jgi:hypothetical protein
MAKILASDFFLGVNYKIKLDEVTYANGQYTLKGSGLTDGTGYVYVLVDGVMHTPDFLTQDTIMLTLDDTHTKFQVVTESGVSRVVEYVDNRIKFEFVGDSFIVPTNWYDLEYTLLGAPYDWKIYLDNEYVGQFNGTSAETSVGISLPSTSMGTHTVMIVPADGLYSAGWGRAFGFMGNFTTGGNSETNKLKFTKVLNDPDWAHLLSETDTGNNFRLSQFNLCKNLTNIVPENLPNSVTTIGANFRRSQYHTNLLQRDFPGEHVPDSVTSIGMSYRRQQYVNNANLLIGSYVHNYNFSTLLNTNINSYYGMFWCDSNVPTPSFFDTMPRYYLEDGTTAPVTDLTPTSDKNYVTNRTGIAGYSSLPANWK